MPFETFFFRYDFSCPIMEINHVNSIVIRRAYKCISQVGLHLIVKLRPHRLRHHVFCNYFFESVNIKKFVFNSKVNYVITLLVSPSLL